ncbi:hypothetical protein GCM10019017_01520 [Streptomyces showdoensis]
MVFDENGRVAGLVGAQEKALAPFAGHSVPGTPAGHGRKYVDGTAEDLVRCGPTP